MRAQAPRCREVDSGDLPSVPVATRGPHVPEAGGVFADVPRGTGNEIRRDGDG